MPRVCILDYGSGNVRSVYNLLAAICYDVVISNETAQIERASHLILPGVGAFGAAMSQILERIPIADLENAVLRNRVPFLGICVGMQVLAETGDEFGRHRGLGWLPGVVRSLRSGKLPLPHVGWNESRALRPSPLIDSDSQEDYYFVHSYVFEPTESAHVVARTEYGEHFCSIVGRDNIWGVQFHPEKSQVAGRNLLERFLSAEF